MSDTQKQPHNDLKESILSRLEKEGIEPRSRLYWLSHEYALWGAWGATVLCGALALSVASFASLHIGYALYEAAHDNFLTFLFDALPYLWLVTFFLLVAAAYFNLRHTKRGYRYPIVLVVGSSIGFSVLGGGLLHWLGAGWYLDQMLGKAVPAYQSRAKFEEEMWQKPLAGRLVGQVVEEINEKEDFLDFIDADGESWHLNTEELREHDIKLLKSGEKVRILAATSSELSEDALYVCAVFPWILDHAPGLREWREDRAEFIENVKMPRERFREARLEREDDEQDRALPPIAIATENSKTSSVCYNLSVFKKARPDVEE
ncbi:hypothetical protein A2392_01855 [Candidatus Kaiserbacteria bacterium RIFOXYB1_FULL_46_14]|uniref:Uncharacterized protein n=1 Tax=Candidatus Kaiserbacteria bacterium RIFOXYB1_FULL_46_14 TaxID=1798531 RepID=A0A1F6FK20_9BACT|nr:MAG: hypothetical protein A2392_01855 [Candidatus Kaiserbacteria bacterium RIFOXYB1_FULL_46_14]